MNDDDCTSCHGTGSTGETGCTDCLGTGIDQMTLGFAPLDHNEYDSSALPLWVKVTLLVMVIAFVTVVILCV